MAVRMLCGMAGDTWAVKPGDRFEADEAYEQRLVEAGLAEKIEEEKPKKKAK